MSSDARGDRGQDQSSEQQQRPLKRIRQACEPCRRKKSRCTGEKPVCALCERLGQGSRCTYAPDRSDGPRLSGSPTPAVDVNLQHNTSDRLNVLEQGMARVQDLLRELARGPATPLDRESLVAPIVAAQVAPVGGAGFAAGSSRGVGVGAGGGGGDAEDSVAELDKAERLYTTFCDCQPLPLFATGCLALRARVKELQLAVILLVSRFAGGWSLVGANSAQIMQRVRSRVMQTLLDGPVELATLQTMCLLSLVEFNDGSTARASFYSSTAMDLAQSAGLASEHPRSSYKDLEERRRCYWSLILLKNLYGNMAGKSSFIPHDFTPKHPTSTEPPSRSISSITEPGLPQPDPSPGSAPVAEKDLGMLAYVISMTDLWAKVVRYARRRGKSQQPPPWAPEAEYQRIMAELMVLETQMPYKYRFKPARFGDYSTAELQQSRTFWSPWFLNQMLYHSLLSLLNHPLILSLQLRNFKMNQVPEVFLQHTDDLTQTHTNWVVHLVDQITSKDFQPSDPYPAYCVAIVATIFLQQSYADDDQIRSTKQDNFARCLAFIRQLGSYWPRVAQLVCCHT